MLRTRRIRQELRGAWVHKLVLWWAHYNGVYLNEAMRPPVIRLGGGTKTLGSWESERRILTVSEAHIERDPWLAVLDTLRHEMAHQYVDEILHVQNEGPHGEAFKSACEKLRCVSKARASSEDLDVEEIADDRILRLLQKVLSLADSPNENEAQAAMQKAHQLLLKYNIDLVKLNQNRRFEVRSLGMVKGRHTSAELWLASLLNRFFFVETLWVQSYDAFRDQLGTELQVYGTVENLDMAVYVHDYLSHLLDGFWRDYRRDKGIRGNRERQRYFAGVLAGFFQKLEAQEQTLETSQALVWKGDAQLQAFYRYVNPNVQTRHGGGVQATEVYLDGVKDGQRVTIHKPVGEKGDGVRGLIE